MSNGKIYNLENNFYKILIPESLKEYGTEVLEYSTNKLREFLRFFKRESYETKIEGSFFLTREDFFYRIKILDSKANSPYSIEGCFYGGEHKYYLILKIYMRDIAP